MKQGTSVERSLAVIGAGMWFFLAASNAVGGLVPLAVIQAAIGIWAILQVVRWQHGYAPLLGSGANPGARGATTLPVVAWWGLGATVGQLVVAFVWGFVDAARGQTSGTISPLVLGAVAIASGALVSTWLSKASRRRSSAPPAIDSSRASSIPAPPAGSLADHGSEPLHDAGGPTSTLYHLQRVHGVEPDPFASMAVLQTRHAGLHVGSVMDPA